MDTGYVRRLDDARQTMKDVPYGRWRELQPEDTIRFYALRLQEAGMIKNHPTKIIADGTDWRFLNELKKELKGVTLFLAVLATLGFVVAWPAASVAHKAGKDARLSTIGPAPDFTLTTQSGQRLALGDLRGKVVAVTFIYATCTDTCPMLTAKMATLQQRLGKDFGPKVFFVSVTVDPQRDTREVMKRYAEAHGANPAGWAFTTGTPEEIREMARRYGIYYKKNERGDVDHTFLTSIIDQRGLLRVQYLGVRFDPDEMLRDLRSLLGEASAR